MLRQDNKWPYGFSEFCALGAFAGLYTADRYQLIDFVKTPSDAWSGEPWAKLGIVPIASPQSAVELSGARYPIKFVWHVGEKDCEVRPLRNPVRQYNSHRGIEAFRSEIEQILASGSIAANMARATVE